MIKDSIKKNKIEERKKWVQVWGKVEKIRKHQQKLKDKNRSLIP